MAISNDRKFSSRQVSNILDNVIGKTLGEVDKGHSNQFGRALKSPKITGIAGDVIEQSVFGYASDSNQECDIEIDGKLVELKTTGVRVPKTDLNKAKGKTGDEYNIYLGAKEGISITAVTLEPTIQDDFATSHFWEKAQRLLIVFYEYTSYDVVPAIEYAKFPIVGYCYNRFTPTEQEQLRNDWELVRNYLKPYYEKYQNPNERREKMIGFTSAVRPNLLLIELVPGYKKRSSGSYQNPRYRLKQTFVDTIVRGHFDKSRSKHEVSLKEPFSSFAELDKRCHELSLQYKGKTLVELKENLGISSDINAKDFAALCVLKMFDADCKKLNQILDFKKAGIIAKTVTLNDKGKGTEDMKCQHVDFEEWADRDIDFEESQVYRYFMEHSLLCPIFCEHDSTNHAKTTFEGFKRFSFEDDFINSEVRRMWEDSRKLIHTNRLEWIYDLDKNGNRIRNASGSWKGAPNLPKKKDYIVFFRGGASNASVEAKTQIVNNIKMIPQFFWLSRTFVEKKLSSLSFI